MSQIPQFRLKTYNLEYLYINGLYTKYSSINESIPIVKRKKNVMIVYLYQYYSGTRTADKKIYDKSNTQKNSK